MKIEFYLNIYEELISHREMIVYLFPKKIFDDLTENHKFNHIELKEKNVFRLRYKKGNFIMKSNLDYFTILYPSRKRIWSTTYLFEETNLFLNCRILKMLLLNFNIPKKQYYLIYLVLMSIFHVKII